MAKTDILNQLDNSDKHGIVTDEELLQRGVIYDSRRRLGEDLQRRIFEPNQQTTKTEARMAPEDKISIPRGTSLFEESRVQEINF